MDVPCAAIKLLPHLIAIAASPRVSPRDDRSIGLDCGKGGTGREDALHTTCELSSHRRAVSTLAWITPRHHGAVDPQGSEGSPACMDVRNSSCELWLHTRAVASEVAVAPGHHCTTSLQSSKCAVGADNLLHLRQLCLDCRAVTTEARGAPGDDGAVLHQRRKGGATPTEEAAHPTAQLLPDRRTVPTVLWAAPSHDGTVTTDGAEGIPARKDLRARWPRQCRQGVAVLDAALADGGRERIQNSAICSDESMHSCPKGSLCLSLQSSQRLPGQELYKLCPPTQERDMQGYRHGSQDVGSVTR
mmetsp:Transcript_29497/g.84440  ORF Transcript_29497/g.84440 Transcript_29497/m.84440 type:complete len:302 (-) Transcript_29497:8-913(-)